MKIDSIPFGKITLSNGFTIYYIERPVPDVVYMYIFYRAGSGYEKEGVRGISHFLEHLMFKGTRNYPKNYLETLLSKYGGDSNAYTSWDSTVFYAQFPSCVAQKVFMYERDRMERLSFEDFDKELAVVLDEKQLSEKTNPTGLFSERLFYTTFLLHPYRYPVIGTEKDLLNMTEEKVYDYYNAFYSPENAFMVLSGNVGPDVIDSAVKVFQEVKKRGTFHRVPSCDIEPAQNETRSFVMKRKGFGTNVVSVVFKTVPFYHEDTPYLDVLSSMLGAGKNSYLYEKLVIKEGLFTSINSEVYETQACTLHSIGGVVAKDKNPKRAVERLMRYIENPVGLFTKNRFKRTIFNVYADLVYSRESIRSQGEMLGEFVLLAKDSEFNDFPLKLLSVEFNKLKEVYNRYFKVDYATYGILTE